MKNVQKKTKSVAGVCCERRRSAQDVKEKRSRKGPVLGLYTILSLSILCVIYNNNGGSGGNIILRNCVGDDRGVGCLNKGWVRRVSY